MTSLLVAKCEVPKTLTLLLFIQGVTFLILFTNFYIKSYIVKNNKNSNQKQTVESTTENAKLAAK